MSTQKADYQRQYRQRADVKAKARAYAKEQYETRPEVRERDRLGHKRRYHTPEGKAKYRAYELRKKYGITPEILQSMLVAQGCQCAACGTTEWGRNGPNVDHDHITGKVRGLLCQGCNLALGHLDDDLGRARKLADYLVGVATAEAETK